MPPPQHRGSLLAPRWFLLWLALSLTLGCVVATVWVSHHWPRHNPPKLPPRTPAPTRRVDPPPVPTPDSPPVVVRKPALIPKPESSGIGPGEPQLFVVWHGGMPKFTKIVQDIAAEFRILRVRHMDMPRATYLENLWRLYMGKGGLARKKMQLKVKQCGGVGDFVAILVWDTKPKYDRVKTAHGFDTVSTRMHSSKYKYRKWAGGSGFQVHGTYNVEESEHDTLFLFGATGHEIAAESPERFDVTAPLPPADPSNLLGARVSAALHPPRVWRRVAQLRKTVQGGAGDGAWVRTPSSRRGVRQRCRRRSLVPHRYKSAEDGGRCGSAGGRAREGRRR
eukprot:TRINITY_DN26126_c0_g1_i1.p1 TRINITY_DN26126_c0_g1~~TRINITY_DN26126_c0_g1_i1.p1  ORF type:complete len:363 (+),score=42.04 TRINITY_DN26126_c0_g1_i1:83-1090(+)